jgi:hypothetical protein
VIGSFLLYLVFQNWVIPTFFTLSWTALAVKLYRDLQKKADRDYNNAVAGTQTPQGANTKYSDETIRRVKAFMEERMLYAQNFRDKSIKDSYVDLVHSLQLCQYLQILLSLSIASYYYLTLLQLFSLTLILQAIFSAISNIFLLEVRHRFYPREIKIIKGYR